VKKSKMSEQIITVEFGIKAKKQIREEIKNEGKEYKTAFYPKAVGYLMDGFLNEMKKQGYKKIGRARLIFEEAIDWQAKFEASRIIDIMNKHNGSKIPKYAFFKIGDEIPKVE
jgi:hypothetical protein